MEAASSYEGSNTIYDGDVDGGDTLYRGAQPDGVWPEGQR